MYKCRASHEQREADLSTKIHLLPVRTTAAGIRPPRFDTLSSYALINFNLPSEHRFL
jgi:hypothetical protein